MKEENRPCTRMNSVNMPPPPPLEPTPASKRQKYAAIYKQTLDTEATALCTIIFNKCRGILEKTEKWSNISITEEDLEIDVVFDEKDHASIRLPTIRCAIKKKLNDTHIEMKNDEYISYGYLKPGKETFLWTITLYGKKGSSYTQNSLHQEWNNLFFLYNTILETRSIAIHDDFLTCVETFLTDPSQWSPETTTDTHVLIDIDEDAKEIQIADIRERVTQLLLASGFLIEDSVKMQNDKEWSVTLKLPL